MEVENTTLLQIGKIDINFTSPAETERVGTIFEQTESFLSISLQWNSTHLYVDKQMGDRKLTYCRNQFWRLFTIQQEKKDFVPIKFKHISQNFKMTPKER